MKKSVMKQRKGMALLFAGTLMLTAITSGCGKKDIDYDSVQQAETTQTGLDAYTGILSSDDRSGRQ